MAIKNNKYLRYLYTEICSKFVYIFYNLGPNKNKLICLGLPQIELNENSQFKYGTRVVLVSNSRIATLGHSQRCKFLVYRNAILELGNNVGMSNVTIVATKKIIIGSNVMIGGGVTIVDSDFHSLDYKNWFTPNDEKNMISKDVAIGDNVFIGMNSLILKGVSIGNNSIVAAGSIVTKSIPSNELWGGNPAVFIKKHIV